MNLRIITALSITLIFICLPVYTGNGGEKTNSSVSWVEVAPGLNNNAMIMGLASTPDGKVYSGSAGGGTYVTGDNGNVWNKLTMKNADIDDDFTTSVYAHPGGKVYVGQSSGYVFVSQTDGVTFDTLCRIGAGIQGVVSFACDKENNVYFVSSDGVFGIYGPDNSKIKIGKIDSLNTIVWSIAVDFMGRMFVGTMGEGIYCSSDKGETWTKANNGLPSLDVHKVVARYGVLYAGLSENGGLYKSINEGESWQPSMEGMGSLIVMDIIFCRNLKVILVATTKDIFISDNNGETWNSIKNDLPDLTNYRRLALDEDDYLYVGSLVGKIYRTREPVKIDKGRLSISLEPSSEINVEPGKSASIVVTISDTENMPVENACVWVSDSLINKKKALYTDKYGQSKYLISVSPNCAQGDYQLTFYAIEGEHKTSDTVRKIVHVKPEVSAPKEELIRPIELSVHPNPATNEFTISFDSMMEGLAEISLYDLRGNKAATIPSGLIKKGNNDIPCPVYGLAHGVYFLRLRIDETISTAIIIIDN